MVKSLLTWAISLLEESCKHLSKAPEDASSATKMRLAAAVVEILELVTKKQKKSVPSERKQ